MVQVMDPIEEREKKVLKNLKNIVETYVSIQKTNKKLP